MRYGYEMYRKQSCEGYIEADSPEEAFQKINDLLEDDDMYFDWSSEEEELWIEDQDG